jgi:hypothetical protein
VLYMLYNPLRIPWSAEVPARPVALRLVRNRVGTRIVDARDMHALVNAGVRKPRYIDIAAMPGDSTYTPFSAGWKLQDFIVDLLLACHVGYITEAFDDTLSILFNARTRPISSAFAVNIEVGDG